MTNNGSDQENEKPPVGRPGASQDFDNAVSSKRRVTDESTLNEWTRQVMLDDTLELHEKTWLVALSSLVDKKVWIAPLSRQMMEDAGIPRGSYYTYIDGALESGYVEKAGTTKVKPGKRAQWVDTYRFVMKV